MDYSLITSDNLCLDTVAVTGKEKKTHGAERKKAAFSSSSPNCPEPSRCDFTGHPCVTHSPPSFLFLMLSLWSKSGGQAVAQSPASWLMVFILDRRLLFIYLHCRFTDTIGHLNEKYSVIPILQHNWVESLPFGPLPLSLFPLFLSFYLAALSSPQ